MTGHPKYFNPLKAELNPIRHLLAFVGARHIVHVSRVTVNDTGLLFRYVPLKRISELRNYDESVYQNIVIAQR